MMGWRRNLALSLAGAVLLYGAVLNANAQILSSKRGFSDTGASYSGLQVTGAGWYYTWGTGAGNPGNFDAKHVPMFWYPPSQASINDVKNRAGVEWVLGFNEPEREDQANLTVAQAISSWTTISNSFAGTGIKLISPGVADTGGADGGTTWLANFMSQASSAGLQVDAVAFHWYGVSTPANPAGAASSFLSRVDSYHNSYNKPVWITEFAIHDWGGAYTNEEIIEANRQFLDIVVPALESRSYVAGYSFYPWFNDGPLFDGGRTAPTPMGYSYAGVVTSGKTANIGSQNLGEHVAFLAGGDLTATGSAPTSIRYINALSGTSTVSGSVDWQLASGANWVKVQTGATLRKTGTNQVTLGTGAITNNGAIEVSQGTLRIGGVASGAGSAVVKGGTLSVMSAGRLNVPLVDVRGGGTLNVVAMNAYYTLAAGRTLNNDRNGSVLGNVAVSNGAIITGGGAFTGDMITQAGALVRVGKDAAGTPSRFVIDNFESYATGDVETVATPPWTAHQDTTFADIENYSGNKVLTYGYASGARGVSRSLPDAAIIDNSETATIFFRINSKTASPDNTIGLGDKATTTTVDFADFETQLRLKAGTATTFSLDARNGGAFSATLASNLALNTWYNIWMVVNQTADQYNIYMNTGTGAATAANKLNAAPLAFRNGTTSDLNTILALGGTTPVDNGVRIDDLYFQTGTDLSNPLLNFNPGLAWTAETIAVSGNFTLSGGATLDMNIFDPAQRDVLSVAGQAFLSGVLNVTFAVGAPAPQAGNVFDLLDIGTTNGSFSALNLPALAAGLNWDTSALLTTGALAVVAAPAGDFDHDFDVDSDDFLAWQRGESVAPGSLTDLTAWQEHYGTPAPAWATAAVSARAIPEPGSALLAVGAMGAATVMRRRRVTR